MGILEWKRIYHKYYQEMRKISRVYYYVHNSFSKRKVVVVVVVVEIAVNEISH
jgi:hypothetical protein